MQVISRHMTRLWQSVEAHICTKHAQKWHTSAEWAWTLARIMTVPPQTMCLQRQPVQPTSCSHLIPAAFGAACCGPAAAAAAAAGRHPSKLRGQERHIKAQRIVAQDVGALEAAPDLGSHRSEARLACSRWYTTSVSPTAKQILTGALLGFEYLLSSCGLPQEDHSP